MPYLQPENECSAGQHAGDHEKSGQLGIRVDVDKHDRVMLDAPTTAALASASSFAFVRV
jgi:hypothetical protein